MSKLFTEEEGYTKLADELYQEACNFADYIHNKYVPLDCSFNDIRCIVSDGIEWSGIYTRTKLAMEKKINESKKGKKIEEDSFCYWGS